MLPHISAPLPRYRRWPSGFLVLVVAGALLTDPVTPERARLAASSTAGQHAFRQITTNAAFAAGTNEGIRVAAGSMTISKPVGRINDAGRSWSWSRWTSGWVQPGQSFTQLVPTWNVVTPAEHRGAGAGPRAQHAPAGSARWKVMGSWATRDAGFRRTSGARQRDSVAWVSTDTLGRLAACASNGYQLRVAAPAHAGSTATPTVRSVQAVASRPATTSRRRASRCTPAGRSNVPRYSQMTHRGQYPQYGGGGEAWCSPTSLSMLLGYYRALPTQGELRLGEQVVRRPLGRPRRPGRLRLRLPRRRQLGLQHRVRRQPDRRRLRDPPGQPARGRAVHPRRHPAGRLDLVLAGAGSPAPRSAPPPATSS